MTRRLGDEQNERGIGLELARVRGRVTRLERRPSGLGPRTYTVKMCSDTSYVTGTFPPAFYLPISRDLTGCRIVDVAAFVRSSPDSGPLEIWVEHFSKAEDEWTYALKDAVGDDGLLTIDEGDRDSYDSTYQVVPRDDLPVLGGGDMVYFEVISPSQDARGLAVAVTVA